MTALAAFELWSEGGNGEGKSRGEDHLTTSLRKLLEYFFESSRGVLAPKPSLQQLLLLADQQCYSPQQTMI